MIPDGQYTAVVDRIEDGLAAVVLEEDATDAYELLVEPAELPEDGQHADAVLSVEMQDGELVEARYEASETKERRESAQSRFDRLSERPPSDDDE
ncbi:DUF3006 domain-containing protein [Halovenus salina]|uniref:DUF3006 domain-containing protein n=1 Tax=Halovenus salina TaxID=1510225 RepID=A0ABD5W8S7_9EURY|nr:DUF3006 domain-containing protein [Halovenus salina]